MMQQDGDVSTSCVKVLEIQARYCDAKPGHGSKSKKGE